MIDSESWTCRGCGGPFIGHRPADDTCPSCVAIQVTTEPPATPTEPTVVELPGWPFELENFELRRSGKDITMRCGQCGDVVRRYTAITLDVFVFVALKHWHRGCPKRPGGGE